MQPGNPVSRLLAAMAAVLLIMDGLGGCGSPGNHADANLTASASVRSLPAGEAIRLKPARPNPRAAPDSNSPLAYFNARRVEVGLPALRSDRAIARAAAEHANYLLKNDRFGHDQTQGTPGFTGSDVTARVRRHTQVDGASEVLSESSIHQPALEAIEQIFNAPFHRGLVLFDWTRAGAAVERTSMSMMVVDFADLGHAIANNELVAYPYADQRNVPYAWVDNEVPDPMGSQSIYRGRQLGFPITLSGGVSAHVELSGMSVTDANGEPVKCLISTSDAADASSKGHNTAVCTPLQPLRPEMRYTVHAQGHLLQLVAATDTPFALSWSFTTKRSRASAPD
jgi:uncharacterized protein YkwD